ncbi:MAG: helix-turn-helix domain-containing protein [Candidatus Asgardarchaeia archaeon]
MTLDEKELSTKDTVLDYVYRMLLEPNSRFTAIMNVMINTEEPITLNEVAQKLGMTKKTAANNLSMLVKTGLIKRLKKNHYYIPQEIKSLLKLIMMLSKQLEELKKKIKLLSNSS